MVSNLLLFLLILTNSVIAIYLAYHLYLKLSDKCKKEENDPFSDADLYYKRLSVDPKQTDLIFP